MNKKFFRIIAILLIMVMFTSSVFSTTLAKYTANGFDVATARVAKWGVVIDTQINSLFSNNYASSGGDNVVVSMNSEEKVLAPGTSKSLMLGTQITGTPEVAFEISNVADVELDNWVNEDGSYYCPLYFTINGKRANGMQFLNANEFEKWIEGEVGKVIRQYGPGTDLSTLGASLGINLSWQWAFEGDQYSNDGDDTFLMEAETKATINFDLTQTVVQIEDFETVYEVVYASAGAGGSTGAVVNGGIISSGTAGSDAVDAVVDKITVGDTIKFGSYPQSKVTDTTLISKLNTAAGATNTWTSYEYNTGDMCYTDVQYGGEKYRGVYFSQYRNQTNQTKFGYSAGTKYWFKYDPISWTVLEESNGEVLILCDVLLDTQHYNFEHAETKDNYAESTIRKWINESFYNTAFNNIQKRVISSYEVDNGNVRNTQDRVFLLTFEELTNSGLQSKVKDFSNYANAQGGCYNYWWIRSGNGNDTGAPCVDYDGKKIIYSFSNSGAQYFGVAPAMHISLDGDFKAYKVIERDENTGAVTKLELGAYPQTLVTEENDSNYSTLANMYTEAKGNLPSNGDNKDWTSYKYYINGDNNTDYMWYVDVTEGGDKYRGVYFDQYRPALLSDPSTADNSEQDENNYHIENVYWFRYDPIKWTILTKGDSGGKALVLCDTIIDSQAFQTEYGQLSGDDWYYNLSEGVPQGIPANTYKYSTIRKWLNDTFYNTSFLNIQQQSILTTDVDNSFESTKLSEIFTSIDENNFKNVKFLDTVDEVFLLSTEDASNPAYGFSSSLNSSDIARQKQATDYAKSQGLFMEDSLEGYNGNFAWFFRSLYMHRLNYKIYKGNLVLASNTRSWAYSAMYVYECDLGVVPAMWINLS